MKKLWKKLLAVTTAVMMAITLLPAMANATETEIEPAAPTIDYTRACLKNKSCTKHIF